MGTKIILLSGVSSSGKTSIAKLLQNELEELYLHISLDAFIEMLPKSNTINQFEHMVQGFHRSILAMVESGLNVIVDHVLIENDWLEDCLNVLKGHPVLFIGLDCSLEELERRERTRDNQRQGYARSQIGKIHNDKQYDLLIDTHLLPTTQCVEIILNRLKQEH